jgi:hypothetical protein
MRVTIIAPDRLVAVDNVAYNGLDFQALPADIHAVQWYGTAGEVEYVTDASGYKKHNTTLDSLAAFQPLLDVWQLAHDAANAPAPEDTEATLLKLCEDTAKQRLEETDWTQLADVVGSLVNKSEFDAYRAIMRSYALTPVVSPVWPDAPTAVWSI